MMRSLSFAISICSYSNIDHSSDSRFALESVSLPSHLDAFRAAEFIFAVVTPATRSDDEENRRYARRSLARKNLRLRQRKGIHQIVEYFWDVRCDSLTFFAVLICRLIDKCLEPHANEFFSGYLALFRSILLLRNVAGLRVPAGAYAFDCNEKRIIAPVAIHL